MSTSKEWTVRKVQQSDSVNDIILKEDLFLNFKAENPEISRDVFFSEIGRLMGSGPFQNVVPYQKKGKKIGYRFLCYKPSGVFETTFQSKEKPKMKVKETFTKMSTTTTKTKGKQIKGNKDKLKTKKRKINSNIPKSDNNSSPLVLSVDVVNSDDGFSNSCDGAEITPGVDGKRCTPVVIGAVDVMKDEPKTKKRKFSGSIPKSDKCSNPLAFSVDVADVVNSDDGFSNSCDGAEITPGVDGKRCTPVVIGAVDVVKDEPKNKKGKLNSIIPKSYKGGSPLAFSDDVVNIVKYRLSVQQFCYAVQEIINKIAQYSRHKLPYLNKTFGEL